jgi:tartrate dehydrogenase/decarboxylase / D-malate dehydrogenase
MSQVGLIVGSGTGRELAEVFKWSVSRIAELIGKSVEVIECEHVFKSYHELLDWTPDQIEEAVQDDLERLTTFYRQFYRYGGRAVFRTAINAETLYRFRSIGKAIKTVYIPLKRKRLLFVRDETQGYYANDSYQINDREIRFSGSFSRDNFQTIARYSLGEADRVLQKPYDVWVVYKHHLFANLMETWARDLFGGAKVYQPNHATDLLFHYLRAEDGRDLLSIMGNETGDILHEVLIFNLGIGTRNTLFSKNVYLHSDIEGLVEYQTVHGSADGIGGQNIVNPLATLRALAAFLEEHLQEANFGSLMEEAIKGAERSGVIGHDAGGRSSTTQIAEAVVRQLEPLMESAR